VSQNTQKRAVLARDVLEGESFVEIPKELLRFAANDRAGEER
jgi:hypothetical protein